MPWWVIPAVLTDIVITLLVVRWVMRRRARQGGENPAGLLNLDFRAMREFTDRAHPRIGDYVRANWSGTPDQLSLVLQALLDELERDAKTRGLALDRDVLKGLLGRSLASHKIGRGSEIRDALAKVA